MNENYEEHELRATLLINSLPDELFTYMLFYLPCGNLMSLKSVSKEWKTMLSNNGLWNEKFCRDFGGFGSLSKFFFNYLLKHKHWTWEMLYRNYLSYYYMLYCEADPSVSNIYHFYSIDDKISMLMSNNTSKHFALCFLSACKIESFTGTNYQNLEIVTESYLIYGISIHLFEKIEYTLQDKQLVVNELDPNQCYGLIDGISSIGLLLVSSKVFDKEPEYQKQVTLKITDICDQFHDNGISISQTNLCALWVHQSILLSDQYSNERDKKKSLQDKATASFFSASNDPVKYYNLACLYSLFNQPEESKKYFMWCFNYCDGQNKELWKKWVMKEFRESAMLDQDFENVRQLPWFKEVLEDSEREEMRAYENELIHGFVFINNNNVQMENVEEVEFLFEDSDGDN